MSRRKLVLAALVGLCLGRLVASTVLSTQEPLSMANLITIAKDHSVIESPEDFIDEVLKPLEKDVGIGFLPTYRVRKDLKEKHSIPDSIIAALAANTPMQIGVCEFGSNHVSTTEAADFSKAVRNYMQDEKEIGTELTSKLGKKHTDTTIGPADGFNNNDSNKTKLFILGSLKKRLVEYSVWVRLSFINPKSTGSKLLCKKDDFPKNRDKSDLAKQVAQWVTQCLLCELTAPVTSDDHCALAIKPQ